MKEIIAGIFKKSDLLNPEAIRSQTIEEFEKKLTPDFIRVNYPHLYHGMRQEWLMSFHIEDLDAPPPPDALKQFLPYITPVIGIITLIYLFMKK